VDQDLHSDVATSDYQEFSTHGRLAEFVFCLWSQSVGPSAEFPQRVLPDGCVDIILMNEVAMVVGPWTKPFVAHLAPNTKIIGARCRPGRAASLLGIPASQLLNSFAFLRDIFSNTETCPFTRIVDEPGVTRKLGAMEAALCKRISKVAPVDKASNEAIEWIARNPRGRVEQLSRKLGLSDRQLLRRFTVAVGYGPKLFQSVLRFQRLLNLAQTAGVQGSLAELAVKAEFADQSHMTREMHRFCGGPPGAALRSVGCALQLAGLIDTSSRGNV